MGDYFQRMIDAQSARLPQLLLERLIRRKVEEMGEAPADDVVTELATKLLAGDLSPVTRDEGPDRAITLAITAEEIQGLTADVQTFVDERFPAMIEEVSDVGAARIVDNLIDDWAALSAPGDAEYANFARNLHLRWGEAIRRLKMMLGVSYEFGHDVLERWQHDPEATNRLQSSVLTRLHARALQVTTEIATLLEHGLPEGALARWRTLDEITTVATVIADHDEDLAERYLLHQQVETKRAAEEYMRCHQALGYAPIPPEEQLQIEAEFAAVVDRYGAPFATPYGWAAHHLRLKKPTYVDLSQAAGRAQLRSHYKTASYQVHAGPPALSEWGDVLIAGYTNRGLEEAGARTAFTLAQLNAVIAMEWTLDDIVAMKVISTLRDQAADAFHLAAQRLEADEDRRLRQIARSVLGKRVRPKTIKLTGASGRAKKRLKLRTNRRPRKGPGRS